MSNDLLIHATGLAALALNVVALTCSCERPGSGFTGEASSMR